MVQFFQKSPFLNTAHVSNLKHKTQTAKTVEKQARNNLLVCNKGELITQEDNHNDTGLIHITCRVYNSTHKQYTQKY